MDAHLVRFSKSISLVLRHQPQKYGLTLDQHG
jgi:RNA:NAD 2'-phosphotransferase (TPT1/KptA family)